jgi:hypothetical protein
MSSGNGAVYVQTNDGERNEIVAPATTTSRSSRPPTAR